MVLLAPGGPRARFPKGFGTIGGAPVQSPLGYPPFLYSNLQCFVDLSDSLATWGGVLKGNNNIYEMFDKFKVR